MSPSNPIPRCAATPSRRRLPRFVLIATPFAGIFALGWLAEQASKFGGVVSVLLVLVIVGGVARVLFHRPRRKPKPATGPSPSPAPAGELVTTASTTE